MVLLNAGANPVTWTCFNSTFTEFIAHSPSPALEYSGTVWAFSPMSSLLLLHPDGSIFSIHNHLAITLFGYSKDELLGKVSQPGLLKKSAQIEGWAFLHFISLLSINRISLFCCLVSLHGCLILTIRKIQCLILMQRWAKAQLYLKY